MEEQTVNQRFELLIKSLEPSQSSFAKKVGTSTGRLSNIIKGRNKPDAQLLAKMVEIYPEVDINWLLTGKEVSQRNVTNPRGVDENFLSKNEGSDASLGASLPASLDASLPQKTASLEGLRGPNKRFNQRDAEVPAEYAHLMNQYEQARSEAEQREWRSIDSRLKSTAYNILLMQELSEEVVGTPFDRDFYPALQKHVSTPRLTYKGNGQFANPLNEMDYETKSKYYADKATLLEESEDMLSGLINDLHEAVFSPMPGRLAPDPREGTVAHQVQDFLKTRFEKRWRQKWDKWKE